MSIIVMACFFLCVFQFGTVSNLSSPGRIFKNMGDMWANDLREVSPLEADATRMVAAAGWT